MMPVYSAMHDVLNLDSFTIFLIVVITILVYFLYCNFVEFQLRHAYTFKPT